MSLVENYAAARKERLIRLGAPQPKPVVRAKPIPVKPQAIDAGWEGMWFYDLLQGFREPRLVVPVREIQEAVCRHYGISALDLISQRHNRKISRARQVGIYLCRLYTPHSYAEIGRRFGHRDHSTALYSVEKIERLLGSDLKLACDVNTLRRVLA